MNKEDMKKHLNHASDASYEAIQKQFLGKLSDRYKVRHHSFVTFLDMKAEGGACVSFGNIDMEDPGPYGNEMVEKLLSTDKIRGMVIQELGRHFVAERVHDNIKKRAQELRDKMESRMPQEIVDMLKEAAKKWCDEKEKDAKDG